MKNETEQKQTSKKKWKYRRIFSFRIMLLMTKVNESICGHLPTE